MCVFGGGLGGGGVAGRPCNRCLVKLSPLPLTLRNGRLIPAADPVCMCAPMLDGCLWSPFWQLRRGGSTSTTTFYVNSSVIAAARTGGRSRAGADGSVDCRLLLLCIDEVPDRRDLPLKHHFFLTASRLNNVVGEDARLHVNIESS